MLRHLKDIKAKIEQKSIHNMKLPFEGPFKNKYAGRSPERILCLNSVRLVCVTGAQWSETAKNRDVSTGPLARPFARSLAPLTRSLAPDCSLRSRPPLRSLVRSLARSLTSLTPSLVGQ